MLALCGTLHAQENPRRFSAMLKSDARDAWKATGRILGAPFHATTNEYLMAVGILGGAVLTCTLDRTMYTAVRRQRGGFVNTVNHIGHFYQGPQVNFGAAGILYGSGLIAHSPGLRRTGAEIVEAIAISAGGSHILKFAVGRSRPYAGRGPFHFRFGGPIWHNEHASFPSGDVTAAFAFSSVLAAETKSWPIAVALYGLSSTVAFQRMNINQHWFSDTVCGAVLGTAVGWGVVHVNRRLHQTSVRVALEVLPDAVGLRVAL